MAEIFRRSEPLAGAMHQPIEIMALSDWYVSQELSVMAATRYNYLAVRAMDLAAASVAEYADDGEGWEDLMYPFDSEMDHIGGIVSELCGEEDADGY